RIAMDALAQRSWCSDPKGTVASAGRASRHDGAADMMRQGGAVEPLRIDGRSRLGWPVYNHALGDPSLIACPHCDLLQRLSEIPPGASARCPRCDTELRRRREDVLNRTLALGVAALVLYVVANTSSMLGLTVVGRQAFTTVFGGAAQLWHDGREAV